MRRCAAKACGRAMSSNRPSAATLIVSSSPALERIEQCEPITIGVPLPRGRVRDPRRIGCADADGNDVRLQALPTDWWADGSIRWALLDFQATGAAGSRRCYQLDFDRAGASSHG